MKFSELPDHEYYTFKVAFSRWCWQVKNRSPDDQWTETYTRLSRSRDLAYRPASHIAAATVQLCYEHWKATGWNPEADR